MFPARPVLRIALCGIFATSLAARTFTVDGVVVAVDPAARSMLVSHRPIGNYMGAMMMPFQVEDPAELAGLHPGARILFDLTVGRERSVARRIRRTGESDLPPAKPGIRVGDPLPEFTLTDSTGRTTNSAELLGKVVAIDFIYTRCPLPEVCPRLSANFASLQRRFRDRMGTDLVLLSVTVDPEYDRPAVLAEYSRRWSADPRGWRFLTGDVGPLAGALGEVYWADEGTIGHNSMTSIVGRDGRLAAVVEGADYRPDQLAHLVERILEEKR
jgi:protein SCO1/2